MDSEYIKKWLDFYQQLNIYGYAKYEIEPLKVTSSWDGLIASGDDWLDTILYIREVLK